MCSIVSLTIYKQKFTVYDKILYYGGPYNDVINWHTHKLYDKISDSHYREAYTTEHRRRELESATVTWSISENYKAW